VALWDQLNTKTIKDVASTDIQRLSDAIHLEEQNRNALMDVVLINKSQLRDGSPMPDQGKIVQTTGDSDRIQFQPEPGQVWLFVGGDWLSQSGGTSAMNVELRDADGNTTFLFNESTSGQVPLSPALYGADLYVTNTLYLYANITSGEGRLSTAFVRVR
jgi:hypothetical protein